MKYAGAVLLGLAVAVVGTLLAIFQLLVPGIVSAAHAAGASPVHTHSLVLGIVRALCAWIVFVVSVWGGFLTGAAIWTAGQDNVWRPMGRRSVPGRSAGSARQTEVAWQNALLNQDKPSTN